MSNHTNLQLTPSQRKSLQLALALAISWEETLLQSYHINPYQPVSRKQKRFLKETNANSTPRNIREFKKLLTQLGNLSKQS